MLPQADIEEVQKLESAAIASFKNQVVNAAQTIIDIANGNLTDLLTTPALKLRYDAATQIVNRVLGPIKTPASDWVTDYLAGIRNAPETKEQEAFVGNLEGKEDG